MTWAAHPCTIQTWSDLARPLLEFWRSPALEVKAQNLQRDTDTPRLGCDVIPGSWPHQKALRSLCLRGERTDEPRKPVPHRHGRCYQGPGVPITWDGEILKSEGCWIHFTVKMWSCNFSHKMSLFVQTPLALEVSLYSYGPKE